MTLLGIPGDNTFSNYQEARRAFWRSTVLPLVTLVTRTAKGAEATDGEAAEGLARRSRRKLTY